MVHIDRCAKQVVPMSLLLSLVIAPVVHAQQAPAPLTPFLSEMTGTWSVSQTTWDGPGASAKNGSGAVAIRRVPVGGGFVEENMTASQPASEAFTRLAQINYNITAKAYEYATLDTRAPQQMHYRSQVIDPAVTGPLAFGGGTFVAAEWNGQKTVPIAYRVRMSPVVDDRQQLQIFFRPLVGQKVEYLATQYDYRRMR